MSTNVRSMSYIKEFSRIFPKWLYQFQLYLELLPLPKVFKIAET